jgi:murein DD-endopeptidase MepM/ murein hydrolase activator NlpD
MDRPRYRWFRSLFVVSGVAGAAFLALGGPAGAAGNVTGTVVVGSGGLSVRSGASQSATRLGSVAPGTVVTVVCQINGQRINGRVRSTDRWDRLPDGRYISDAYVRHTGSIETCPTQADPTAPAEASAGTPAPGSVAGSVAVAGGSLNVRAGASASSARLGSLGNGTAVTISCQVPGQWINGSVRGSDRWDRLANGSYLADGYVRRSAEPATCPVTNGREATGGTPVGRWLPPLAGYRTRHGFRTAARPNHDGEDIVAPRETPIRATADGTVVTVRCNTSTGNCDVDGSLSTGGCGWYVEIRHAGNVVTRYCHLVRRPDVSVGQSVSVGQVIGRVGSSGNSSGPHLHFEVHTGSPATRANAVDPIDFMRRAGAALT